MKGGPMIVAVDVTIQRFTLVEVEVPDDATDEEIIEAALQASETSTEWGESPKEATILQPIDPS
jgi:hypothetical protein